MMCVEVRFMPGGQIWPCHRCWQCRRDRVDDWVGRCIAESKTARSTIVGTLTYGTDPHYRGVDHVNAHALFYSDVQLWLKRVRRWTAGRVRFAVAGEYGSKKGRAHWHVLLFLYGEQPPGIRFRERYVHEAGNGRKLWPHGWSYWDDTATPEAIRYVVKYVLKDTRKERLSVFHASTQPLLGSEFFRQLAVTYVQQQLPPRLRFRFAGEYRACGKPKEYRMSHSAAFHFLAFYDKYWKELYGNEAWPASEIMETYCDERLRRSDRDQRFIPLEWQRRWELELAQRGELWATALGKDGNAANLVQYWNVPARNLYLEASKGV